jgi:hypothetical protein
VRLEGLGKLEKSSDLIGNRTRNLPAYNSTATNYATAFYGTKRFIMSSRTVTMPNPKPFESSPYSHILLPEETFNVQSPIYA